MIRVEVDANPFRDGPDPFPRPVVFAKSEADAPPWISRLGAEKATFLCEGIAQRDALKRGEILELFAGSSLSTATLCRTVRGADQVVAADLRYAIGQRSAWAYACEENFDRVASVWKTAFRSGPKFVALDAARLPFDSARFDAVLMPDSPRDAAERFADAGGMADARLSGGESDLDYAAQRRLFVAAVAEAYRVLRPSGVLAGTAPVGWTRAIDQRAWTRWQVFSSERLGDDVTVLSVGRRLRFRTEGALDPVVYFRGVR
jgi:SAM-dependent methyltransferase